MRKNVFRKRGGFSLVEIMVVVAVIAILAASVGNIMGGSSDKAKYARAERDLESLYQAFVNVLYAKDGDMGAAIAVGSYNLNSLSSAVKDNVQKFLNRSLPDIKDPWGNEYKVVVARAINQTGNGNMYVACYDGTNVRTNNGSLMKKIVVDND